MGKFKRALFMLVSMLLCTQGLALFPLAAEGETYVFGVNAINGTRWENFICVYRGVPTTGQNIYGCNIVVDGNGRVIEKLAAMDPKGENLAVPQDGYVVSGIGDNGNKMFNSVNLGDKVLFDEYAMRVLFSASEINPFYDFTLTATGYNSVRGENTVIIYDKAGSKTGTNSYGCEAVVNGEGRIVSVGGNDNVVPRGGYVISVIKQADIMNLQNYFILGASCEKNGNSYTVKYSEEDLRFTAQYELDKVKAELEAAKKQFRLVDYEAVQGAIDAVNLEAIIDIASRNSVIKEIKAIKHMLIEEKSVETRAVWYEMSKDRTAEEIKKTVSMVKDGNFNELLIYVTSSKGTLVPIPDSIPFNKDPITESFDFLQHYVDECKAKGISLTVVIPVMSNSLADDKAEWLDATNTGEAGERFFSPANAEYRKAFMDYLRYIIDNYDIDGIQLDYIRYPGYFGGVESGYDDDTIALFEEKTGYGKDVVEEIGKQKEKHPQWSVWRNFKIQLINGWVEECYNLIKQTRPDIYVSAAVAEGMAAATYSQDFEAWVNGGYMDGIYPMTYHQGVNESTATLFNSFSTDKSYVVMGSGAYLGRTHQQLVSEVQSSLICGGSGVSYFEFNAMRDNGYFTFLAESLYKKEALPITGAKDKVVSALLSTAKNRIALYNGANAEEVKAVNISSSDKADIEKAVKDIEALISSEDAKWLLCDLKTAIRVLNMKADTNYTFVKGENGAIPPTEDEAPNDGSDVSSAESKSEAEADKSEAEGDEGKSNILLWAVIAVLAVVAVIAAVVLVKKQNDKKRNTWHPIG